MCTADKSESIACQQATKKQAPPPPPVVIEQQQHYKIENRAEAEAKILESPKYNVPTQLGQELLCKLREESHLTELKAKSVYSCFFIAVVVLSYMQCALCSSRNFVFTLRTRVCKNLLDGS